MSTKTNTKYSFLIGLEKSVFRAVVVGVPIIVGVLPEAWMNMTIGGALMLLLNWVKNHNN